MALVLWPLLLPAAAVSGWWAGRKNTQTPQRGQLARLSREYYVGLNYLLNEQPDKAVDIFIKLLEVDGDTVETHLALGSLFRRRGEVDRAIRIHQNLIARPQLGRDQRSEALLALGRDYMSAGVLDRAERIFREIVSLGDEQATAGLQYLLDIYQQEKAWDQAIRVAQALETATGVSMHSTIAHHYCEMTEVALKEMNLAAAKRYLKKAIAEDKRCVRASMLQARIAVSEHQLQDAINLYQQVKRQDPRFLIEAIRPMIVCYESLGDIDNMLEHLHRVLHEYPRVKIVLILAECLRQYRGLYAAKDFLSQQLRQNPSLAGMQKLTEWQLASNETNNIETVELLNDISKQLLEDNPVYRCDNCGFSGKTLHWQCPGCKQWSTITPIRI